MTRTSIRSSAVLRRGLLAGVAAATLVLAACGGHDSRAGSGTGHGGMAAPAAAPSGNASTADVMFAQSMIKHHQQALTMAALAGTRAANPEVKALASKIRAAQQPEIDTMNEWLTAWGVPGTEGQTPDMGHGSMPGMMTAEQMNALSAAQGAAFDRQFLTMMIDHHEGAVEMARQQAAQGSSPEATALAQKIIADQQAEITTMKGLLDRL